MLAHALTGMGELTRNRVNTKNYYNMKTIKKLTMMLVALIVTTGAWAQAAYNANSAEVSPYAATTPSFAIPEMPRRAAASIGDLVLSFNAYEGGQYGIVTDGTYFYTSNWGYSEAEYQFCKYDLQGNFIEGFGITGAGTCRGLAFDGTYFYGVANGNTIYQMDFTNKTLVGTISINVAARGLTYDYTNDGFWIVGNWAEPLALYNRSGVQVKTGIYAGSVSDIAYYLDTDGEEHILQCNNGNNDVYDYNITTNTLNTTPVFNLSSIPGYDGGSSGGCHIGAVNGQMCFLGNLQQGPNLIGVYAVPNAVAPNSPNDGTYDIVPGTNEHGALSFKVDGEEVTETEAGKTVTITVTPDANYAVYKITANAYVDWDDALVPSQSGIPVLKEIELTPAGNNQWTFTMPEANVEVNVDYQKQVTLSLTGGDITAALNDAAGGLPIRDLNLTLAAGNYTVSAPITATGNIVITGAGAGNSDTSNATVIDASGLSGAGFISYTEVFGEKAKKDDGSDSPYTIVQNVKIVGVNIKGLAKPIVNNTADKILFKNLIVDNSVIEIVGNNNVFNLGRSYAEVCNITKSTIWSKAGQKNFFFKADGKPADVSSTATTKWTVDQCDLYNIAVEKKANNSNGGIKGKKTTTMVLKSSILYNFGSNKGNEVNGWLWGQNGGANSEYNKNCYWSEEGEVTGWTDASKGGSDQTGTSIVGKPYFKDADNGDFTIGDEEWDDEPSKARIGDPRWLGVFQPEGVTAPLELMPLDGADLYAEVDDGYTRSIAPAYINVTLRPGAHYYVSQPIEVNTTINFIGDENNPAVVDLSQCNGPMLQYSSSLLPAFTMNDKGFWEEPFNVVFKNIIFSQLQNALFADNKQPYLVGYMTLDNCIVEVTTKNSSKKIFDFTGGGVVEHFTISNSTIYGKEKGTEVQLYSSQSGKKATDAGLAMQYFTVTNSTLYNIAYKKNLNSHRSSNQKWLSYTITNNVILDCGKEGQFCKGMNGGQGGTNPTWLVQYNSFMWTNADGKLTNVNESTGDEMEEVSASYLNVYPETEITDIFTKWYSKDMYGNYSDFFRGNFTLSDYSVQKANSLGDPRWLKGDNEYTDIQGVNAEKAAEGEWYTIQGVRVNQPTKGLYIHNGKKVMVK